MSVLALKKAHYHSKKLEAMSRLTLQIFALLVAYQLIMRIFLEFTNVNSLNATTLVDMPLIVFISVYTFVMILKQGYPPSMCGLTMRGWKRAVVESLLMTLPMMLRRS